MTEMIFELIKIIVMVGAFLIGVRILPYLKENVASDKIDSLRVWAQDAVLYAQQLLWSESGEVRKAVVMGILADIRDSQNINLTDEQLEILVEAAVKQLRIDEEISYIDVPIYSEVDDGSDEETTD